MDVLSGNLTFVGWDNYQRMIESGYFFQSIGNTLLIWIMSIIPQLTIAFLLALILSNKWFRGRFILRNIYYFPNLVTPVTIGLLFGAMFSYPGGAINNIISALGLDFEKVKNCLESEEDAYCIYVGIAVKEDVRSRLDWHVNQINTPYAVKSGFLSTPPGTPTPRYWFTRA